MWPRLAVADWIETRDTLQLYMQVIGKVRLVNESLHNHWWNVPLYITARGLTTSLMPHPTGPSFQIDLDLVDHHLVVTTITGERRSLRLEPLPVADLYHRVLDLLVALDVPTTIWPVPVEIAGAVPFPDDRTHASYDPDAVHRYWLMLVEIERVLKISAVASSARPARSTCSGVRSTSLTPASPVAPRRTIPAVRPTAGHT